MPGQFAGPDLVGFGYSSPTDTDSL